MQIWIRESEGNGKGESEGEDDRESQSESESEDNKNKSYALFLKDTKTNKANQSFIKSKKINFTYEWNYMETEKEF